VPYPFRNPASPAGALRAPSTLDGICELTLETPDPERLARFYERALGCRAISRSDDRIWLACGERTRLGLWSPGRKEFGDRGGRHVHFALSTGPGRIEGLAERLAELGVEFRGPVEHDGGDRSLYVEDPEGNVVELWDFFERDSGALAGVDALA
jgi:catechol-2,3-dioxygenase